MRILPEYLGSDDAIRERPWLPVEPRPTTVAIAQKQTALTSDLKRWTSPDAFISHTIFESPIRATSDGQSHANVPAHGVVLLPNAWPYQTPAGTHHDVLWLADGMTWSDSEIDRQLITMLPRNAQYVWYDNPKPSFTHTHPLRHVQVLWKSPVPLCVASHDESTRLSCADGGTVIVDRRLFGVFSTHWRSAPASRSSAFSTKKVHALRATIDDMVGRYDNAGALEYSTLCMALGPAWAYAMHGVLAYGLRLLAAYESFSTQAEDLAFQSAIMWYDAHGYMLPMIVRLRMMKTTIGSSWIGAPYMWKLSTDALLPGFSLTRLRSHLLLDLRQLALAHDDITRMSPVDIVLRLRYSRRMLHRMLQRRMRFRTHSASC